MKNKAWDNFLLRWLVCSVVASVVVCLFIHLFAQQGLWSVFPEKPPSLLYGGILACVFFVVVPVLFSILAKKHIAKMEEIECKRLAEKKEEDYDWSWHELLWYCLIFVSIVALQFSFDPAVVGIPTVVWIEIR